MLVVRPRRGHDRPRRGEPARLAGDAEYSLILLAARVLHALAVYGSDESLDQAAERTLQGVGASRGALVALAISCLARASSSSTARRPTNGRPAPALRRADGLDQPPRLTCPSGHVL
jgi:hypothetical protein